MNRLMRLVPLLLFAFLLVVGIAGSFETAAAGGKRYVCPPCGLPCDTLHFDAPGVCPQCGMALVEEGSSAANPAPDPNVKKVAILIFSGVEIIDYTGPYEMFGTAGADVYTVAESKASVTTAMGMVVTPKYTFADAPQPDVLVIPGGGVKTAVSSEPTLQYIKDVTAHDRQTMSVCNGAFILASTGLLDGLAATTTNGNIPRMAKQFPNVKVVRDQRYVDNGKLVTTAGLSAGIDGALHVIAKLYGLGYAQSVALAQEYDWKPDGGFVRASLADHEIPNVDLSGVGKWDLLKTEGDARHWALVMKGTSDLTAADLMQRLDGVLSESKWTRVDVSMGHANSLDSSWRFCGSDGRPWKGTVKIESGTTDGHQYTATVSVARAG